MKTIKLSAASRSLAEYAADLSNEIVVLTDRDRPVAAIVPLKGLDPEAVALSGHPEFMKIVARSRADFRRGRHALAAERRYARSFQRVRSQPGKLKRHVQHEQRVVHEIAVRQPPRLLYQSEQPLEPAALHPSRRLAQDVRVDIERCAGGNER